MNKPIEQKSHRERGKQLLFVGIICGIVISTFWGFFEEGSVWWSIFTRTSLTKHAPEQMVEQGKIYYPRSDTHIRAFETQVGSPILVSAYEHPEMGQFQTYTVKQGEYLLLVPVTVTNRVDAMQWLQISPYRTHIDIGEIRVFHDHNRYQSEICHWVHDANISCSRRILWQQQMNPKESITLYLEFPLRQITERMSETLPEMVQDVLAQENMTLRIYRSATSGYDEVSLDPTTIHMCTQKVQDGLRNCIQ